MDTNNVNELMIYLLKCREMYYKGEPIIPDIQYDNLENHLKTIVLYRICYTSNSSSIFSFSIDNFFLSFIISTLPNIFRSILFCKFISTIETA